MHLDRVPALRLTAALVGERVLGGDLVGRERGAEEGEGEEGEGEAHCGCRRR